ncbi:MAG TPA: hypothetical protein VMO80_02260 [Terriglobales bacterium]|jgi:hypothetical protein|nr:hypothetical protein [Terriglobales bacterium]
MRLSRLFTVLLVFLASLLLSSAALADSVNLALIGPGGNNGGGVYTYPYNFSINGGPSTPLICDTFDNEIISGESWTANVNGLLSGNGLFGNDPLAYKAAGLIFEGILAHTVNPTVGNWAIWGLFSSNAATNPYFFGSGAALLDAQYLLTAVFTSNSAVDGLVLYTPVSGTQSWGGTPQEFIGLVPAPEPGELSLIFTTLLFGLAGIICGKKLGLKPVVPLKG